MIPGVLARATARAAAAPTQTDVALAVVLWAVVSFPATTTAEVEHADGAVLGAALNAALVAPLVVRRRRPLVALAVCGAASVAVGVTFGPVGGEAATLLALATVASREATAGRRGVWRSR